MSTAEEILSLIEELRAPEGASITINCQNPDFNGLKNECVIYCGPATNWKDERFDGDTLVEALRVVAKTVAIRPMISHIAAGLGYKEPRCKHGTLTDHCPDCAPDYSEIEANEKAQAQRRVGYSSELPPKS